MLATIQVALITIMCVAQFYLKNNPLTSFVTAVSAMLGMMIAFNFYELLGGLLIQKGYLVTYANGICFLLLFGVCFALFRVLSGLLVGSSIDFGNIAKTISAIVFGIITGLIVSGCLMIAVNMAGLSGKLSYKRFDDTITKPTLDNPHKCIIPADDFVAGLFGWISKGSMSSKKSFAVYHADYINKLHLSKHLIKDGVLPVSSRKAINIPAQGVRPAETSEGQKYTAIRLEIDSSKIDKGGAADKDSNLSFGLYQVRVICKNTGQKNTFGSASKVIYPTSNVVLFPGGKPQKKVIPFGETLKFEKDEFTSAKGKRLALIDLAFEIPSGMEAVLLEFKNIAVVEVPKVSTSDNVEEQLNAIFNKEQ